MTTITLVGIDLGKRNNQITLHLRSLVDQQTA